MAKCIFQTRPMMATNIQSKTEFPTNRPNPHYSHEHRQSLDVLRPFASLFRLAGTKWAIEQSKPANVRKNGKYHNSNNNNNKKSLEKFIGGHLLIAVLIIFKVLTSFSEVIFLHRICSIRVSNKWLAKTQNNWRKIYINFYRQKNQFIIFERIYHMLIGFQYQFTC